MTGATGVKAPSSAFDLGREGGSDEREASLFDGWEARLEKARAQREKVLAERAAAKGASSSGLHSDRVPATSESGNPNAPTETWQTRLEHARQQRRRVLAERLKQTATVSGDLPDGSGSGLSPALRDEMAELIRGLRSPDSHAQPVSAASAPVSETPLQAPPDQDRLFRRRERLGKNRRGIDDTQIDTGKLDLPAREELPAGIDFHITSPSLTFPTKTAPGRGAPFAPFPYLSRGVAGAAVLALITGLVAVAVVPLPGWREPEPETVATAEASPLTPSVDVESSADMRNASVVQRETLAAQTARNSEDPSSVVVAAHATDTRLTPSLAKNAGGGTAAEPVAPVGDRPTAASEAEPTESFARVGGISTGAVDLPPRVAALNADAPVVVGRELDGNDLTTLSFDPAKVPPKEASVGETVAALDASIAPSRVVAKQLATTAAKEVSAFFGDDRAISVMPTASSALANVSNRAASVASAATDTVRSPVALSARDAAAVPDRPMNLQPASVRALPGRLREADAVSMPAAVAVPTGVVPPTAQQTPRAGSVQTALVGAPDLPSISTGAAVLQAAPGVRAAAVEPTPLGPDATPRAQPQAESAVPVRQGSGVGAIARSPTLLASNSQPGVLSLVREAKPVTGVEVGRAQVRVFAPGSVVEADVGAITADFSASGYDLESFASVGFSISQSNVRYYHAQDAAIAATLAEDTGAELRDFTAAGSRTPPGTVELWLAGNGSGPQTAKAEPARTKRVKRQPAPAVSNRTAQLRNRVIQKLRSATSQ